MSRLSGHAEVVEDAADKLADNAAAMSALAAAFSAADAATITTQIAAASAALTDLRDALGGNEEPTALQPGTGADAGDLYESTVMRNESADFFYTQVLLDIDGLASSGDEAFDIIGDPTPAANAHIGQYTVAEMGTVVAGRITCLETPAGGEIDLDFTSVDEGTLAGSAAIGTGSNGVTLVARAGDWAVNDVRAFTGLPAANQYIYVSQGVDTSTDAGTYTAGKFLLEFWGHTA